MYPILNNVYFSFRARMLHNTSDARAYFYGLSDYPITCSGYGVSMHFNNTYKYDVNRT